MVIEIGQQYFELFTSRLNKTLYPVDHPNQKNACHFECRECVYIFTHMHFVVRNVEFMNDKFKIA